MSLFEIMLIGVGLSMDAVAVSMTNGMVYKNMKASKKMLMPVYFGFFQFLMPIVGFYVGGIFAEVITKYAGIVVFIILGFVGGKMIKDGIQGLDEDENGVALTHKILFFQAIATSIDAFAVGIGFKAMNSNILSTSLLIGITTFVLSTVAIKVGKKFGTIFENKATIMGGVILVIIGLKSLF